MTLRIHLAGGIAIDKAGVESAKWNKIAVAGKFHRADFPGGALILDRAAFEQMISNWKRMGGNALPVDRHHWGDSDDVRVSAEDKIAVGWMEDLRLGESGDLEALIAWNDDGREDITKDRRRYFSPSFSPQAIDRHTGKPQGWTLYGGGLLNDPFLSELPRMAASATSSTNPKTAEKAKEDEMNKLICAAFGLPEDSTDEVIVEHAKKCAAALAASAKLSAEKDEALKLSSANVASVEALKLALTTEKTERAALAEEVVKLQKAATDTAITIEANKLFAAGKLPGMKTESFKKVALAMGLDEAVAIFGAGVGVPMKEMGHGLTETPAPTDTKALQAAYDVELDALIKAGSTSSEAVVKLGRESKFNPLFTLTNLAHS